MPDEILTPSHLGMPVALATKATGVLYLLAVPFTPGVGALVAYTGNHLIFLCGAYILAALGHLVFLSLPGFLAGLFGMTLLSLGYGIIGCCLWPCIGALVDKDLTGKAYARGGETWICKFQQKIDFFSLNFLPKFFHHPVPWPSLRYPTAWSDWRHPSHRIYQGQNGLRGPRVLLHLHMCLGPAMRPLPVQNSGPKLA